MMTTPTFVEDYNAIVDVLNKYNGGCAKADSSIMKPAFSEQATIFGIDKGKLSGGPIEALFTAIDTSFHPSPEAKAAIVRRHRGPAASARSYKQRLRLLLHQLPCSRSTASGPSSARSITIERVSELASALRSVTCARRGQLRSPDRVTRRPRAAWPGEVLVEVGGLAESRRAEDARAQPMAGDLMDFAGVLLRCLRRTASRTGGGHPARQRLAQRVTVRRRGSPVPDGVSFAGRSASTAGLTALHLRLGPAILGRRTRHWRIGVSAVSRFNWPVWAAPTSQPW